MWENITTIALAAHTFNINMNLIFIFTVTWTVFSLQTGCLLTGEWWKENFFLLEPSNPIYIFLFICSKQNFILFSLESRQVGKLWSVSLMGVNFLFLTSKLFNLLPNRQIYTWSTTFRNYFYPPTFWKAFPIFIFSDL